MEIQYEDNFNDSDCLGCRSIGYCFRRGSSEGGPHRSPGRDCLEYAEGGTDCSFTSYAQCEATASGLAAECYGSAVPDNEHLRWQLPRVDLHGLHIRF